MAQYVYMMTILLPLTFFMMLFAFTLHAWMLGYHWFTYGSEVRTSRLSLVVYITGGAILLLSMSALLLFTR